MRAALDRPLAPLTAGRRDVIAVSGAVAGLDGLATAVRVGEALAAVDAGALPRADGARGLSALVPVAPRAAGTLEVAVRVRERNGAVTELALGEVAVHDAPAPAPPVGAPGRIAVCLATYEPDPALLAVQLASLRAQDDPDWVCVVVDDGSSPERLAVLRDLVGDDERFRLHAEGARRGFYRNFERALELVPPDAELVALCDQDDRWHPGKLGRLRRALREEPGAVLAYSDQRLTRPDGTVLRETLWRGRANNHTDLTAMVVANTVTGAATLFRRELLDVLLPFPDPPGYQFHDHWLAIAALALGDLAYVDEPLYDYVQHPGAVFGDVSSGGAAAGRPPRRRPGAVLRAWRAAWAYGIVPRALQARVVLERAGDRVAPAKRAELERLARLERDPAAALALARRGRRSGRGAPSATLGSEGALAGAVAWRWLARAAGRVPALRRGALADAAPPGLLEFQQERLRRWRAEV